eukprot:scaffold22547_cov84-Isochrysis_galbana.AAC.1
MYLPALPPPPVYRSMYLPAMVGPERRLRMVLMSDPPVAFTRVPAALVLSPPPQVLENGMRGRVLVSEGDVLLGGLTAHIAKLASAPRIIIVGCGTSHNAGLIGEYLLETLARIPTEVRGEAGLAMDSQ